MTSLKLTFAEVSGCLQEVLPVVITKYVDGASTSTPRTRRARAAARTKDQREATPTFLGRHDLTGGVRSGSGRREQKERKDRNKTLKAITGPDAYAIVKPCVRI
ncbi:hypothetical protein PIB30_056355 [Stylosanthes scabra]|uniref:Uncharacterized protein n=1 Tax=Stylosanthes scabra TaxID=79078 RepID=A0ABU6ZI02_9FABA|nr:hypothetical protein [Stylosanthes scabra]